MSNVIKTADVKNSNVLRMANKLKASLGKPSAENLKKIAPGKPQKTTHSYRLFSLLKKQRGTASTEDLAAAAELKIPYVSWYMAEMKRVYGIEYEHERGEKFYTVRNISQYDVPPGGTAGRRKLEGQPTISDPQVRPVLGFSKTKGKALSKEVIADGANSIQRALEGVRSLVNQELDRLEASLLQEEEVAVIPREVWLRIKKENQQISEPA